MIREIFFPKWLANTVVVKKKNGKWRVCVYFTDLNRACPKDPFPMPKIDQLVDVSVLHKQNLSRCRDEIPALGEVSIGTGARHEEVTALLSGSYGVRPHRVSPAVIVKKIGLHGPNSQMGNSVGFVRHKVPAAKLGEGTGSC